MATLPDCPNEILRDIASNLYPQDLLSLSRVSRHFHTVSLPFIYSTHILRPSACYIPPGLPSFIQTLLAKPALANHVRLLQVELDYWLSAPPSPGDIQRLPSATSLFQYDAKMQGLHFMQLLRMLPHLTQLDLWLPDDGDVSSRMTHFHAALNDHTMLPVGLQNLREFRSVLEIGFTTELLIAVMALPSIRAIAVAIGDKYGEDSEAEIAGTLAILEMANAAVGSSTVTDLQLQSSEFSERFLAELLAIPRALTRFRHLSSFRQSNCILIGFPELLVSLAPSLQCLSIGFATTDPLSEDETDRLSGRMGALDSWHALEILECPIMALLGRIPLDDLSLVGVLPRGLRCLRVTPDVFWSTEQAVELIVGLLESGETGSLREIRLMFPEYTEIPDSVLERVRRACEEANVVFMAQEEEIFGL